MLLFETPEDYSNATLATLTGAKSLGDIKGDSTSWTGEAASTTTIVNEQGNGVLSYVKIRYISF